MGSYFEKYGTYRISHGVEDVRNSHPEFREGIDKVCAGGLPEYIGEAVIVSSKFQYRFYADYHDVVQVQITKCGEADGGVDVQRLLRIEREVEPIVANMLRSPSKELVKQVVAEFNGSHGWSISEHEAKIVLINIAEHVGH